MGDINPAELCRRRLWQKFWQQATTSIRSWALPARKPLALRDIPVGPCVP
jgi:hypothetical protein